MTAMSRSMTIKQATKKLNLAAKLETVANVLGTDDASPSHKEARHCLKRAHKLIDEVAEATKKGLLRN